MRLLDVGFSVLNSIHSYSCFSLAHCVLPYRLLDLKSMIIVADCWRIVVAENESALVISEKIAELIVGKTIVMDRNVSHRVNSLKHSRVFS